MSDRKFALLSLTVLTVLLSALFRPAYADSPVNHTGLQDYKIQFSDINSPGNAREFLPIAGTARLNNSLPDGSSSREYHHLSAGLPVSDFAWLPLKNYQIHHQVTGSIFILEIREISISGRAGPFSC